MVTIVAWLKSALTVTGPNPFLTSNTHNAAAVGVTTFSLKSGTSATAIAVADNDPLLENTDSTQNLASGYTLNGVTYTTGQKISADYAYVVRPVGSTNPADNITIYVLQISSNNGVHSDHVGFVSSGQLLTGVSYKIVGVPTNADKPAVAYNSLYVCLAAGTLVDTPEGPRPVEALALGDRVSTLDRGAQPILWIGHRKVALAGLEEAQRPVMFRAGSLGPARPAADLVVSPQHRMLARLPVGPGGLLQEVLVPALAYLGRPGVRSMRGLRQVEYYNLLLPAHAVIFANGAEAESFYPGAEGLKLLSAEDRAAILRRYPALVQTPGAGYGRPARPLLRRGQAEALLWAHTGAEAPPRTTPPSAPGPRARRLPLAA